jgi:hypothetical protein
MKRPPASGRVTVDRTGVEIEHAFRIERIAIHTHDLLVGDVGQFPAVDQPAERALMDEAGEIGVGLGAHEIVRGDGLHGGLLRFAVRSGRRVHVRTLPLRRSVGEQIA